MKYLSKFREIISIKPEFTNALFVLMIGIGLAEMLSFLVSPVLTRLFLPSAFGAYAVFMSLVNVFTVVVNGRYESAIVLPKEEKHAVNLIALSFIVNIVFCAVLFLIIVAFNTQITLFLGNRQLGLWLYILPLFCMLVGLSQISENWLNRKKSYSIISLNRISSNLLSAAVKVLTGFQQAGAGGLILGNLTGAISASLVLSLRIITKDRKYLSWVSMHEIISQAYIYRNFPCFDIGNNFLYALSVSGVVALINKYFGETATGYYSLAYLVLATPCNIYTNAFSQVFYQKLSFVYNHERGEFRKYLRKSIRGTILLATLPFLLFTIYSKDLVVLIFGIKWAGVVPYFYILAPIVYLNLVITPLGNVMKILNKQYVSLMLSFVSSLFKILTIILLGAIILKGPIVALSVFSMISCLVGVITAGIIMKHANIGFLNEVTCIVPFLGMYFYKFIYQLLIKA